MSRTIKIWRSQQLRHYVRKMFFFFYCLCFSSFLRYSIIQGIQTTSVQSKGIGDRGLINWVVDGVSFNFNIPVSISNQN